MKDNLAFAAHRADPLDDIAANEVDTDGAAAPSSFLNDLQAGLARSQKSISP